MPQPAATEPTFCRGTWKGDASKDGSDRGPSAEKAWARQLLSWQESRPPLFESPLRAQDHHHGPTDSASHLSPLRSRDRARASKSLAFSGGETESKLLARSLLEAVSVSCESHCQGSKGAAAGPRVCSHGHRRIVHQCDVCCTRSARRAASPAL